MSFLWHCGQLKIFYNQHLFFYRFMKWKIIIIILIEVGTSNRDRSFTHKMCSFFLLLCGWFLLIVQFSELRFPSEMPSHCYCLSFISLNSILLVATLLFCFILIFYPSLVQWVQSLFPWSLPNMISTATGAHTCWKSH